LRSASIIDLVGGLVITQASTDGLLRQNPFWLVEYNWIGYLVLVFALLLAVVAASFFVFMTRRRERKEWAELDSKYGGRDDLV
jgi:hypothetical protein